MAWYEPREDRLGTRIQGPEKQSKDGDGDSIGDDVRYKPGEELKDRRPRDQNDNKQTLAYYWSQMSEEEAT